MTEEEAKTKWCPMVRWTKGGWSDDVYAAHNRYVDEKQEDQNAYNRCIASGCMMWRTTLHGTEGKVYEGYCGLAGKP